MSEQRINKWEQVSRPRQPVGPAPAASAAPAAGPAPVGQQSPAAPAASHGHQFGSLALRPVEEGDAAPAASSGAVALATMAQPAGAGAATSFGADLPFSPAYLRPILPYQQASK